MQFDTFNSNMAKVTFKECDHFLIVKNILNLEN
jgi:hypothetical protein